jgi:hypothetical protein
MTHRVTTGEKTPMPLASLGRRALTLLVAAGFLAGGCGGSSTKDPPTSGGARIPAGGVLSITPVTANIPPRSGQEVLDALRATYDAGARGYYLAYRWSELEPAPGQYAITDLQNHLNTVDGIGFTRIFISIHVINTNQKETPADLKGVAWDAPQMQSRFRALLDQVLPLLGSKVAFFAIGNEVDAWLGPNNEWAAYQSFFSQGRSYVRASKPALPVGVATIFDGARGPWKPQVQALNALADVAIYTYYGNGSGFQALPPSAGSQALTEMVSLAAGKPVIVQEFGQSSSTVNGGSEALQAQFFTTSLATWSAIGGAAMPFFSVFALHDFPPTLCDQLLTYYGTGPNTPFREYLCYLGLKRQTGTAKPAFDAVKAFGTR